MRPLAAAVVREGTPVLRRRAYTFPGNVAEHRDRIGYFVPLRLSR